MGPQRSPGLGCTSLSVPSAKGNLIVSRLPETTPCCLLKQLHPGEWTVLMIKTYYIILILFTRK